MPNKIEGEKNLSRKGRGRPKGAGNKTTALLKEAILMAAQAHGEDDKGKGKLQGYMRLLAREERKAFAQLLGKVLPLQVTGDPDDPDGGKVIFQTVYETK